MSFSLTSMIICSKSIPTSSCVLLMGVNELPIIVNSIVWTSFIMCTWLYLVNCNTIIFRTLIVHWHCSVQISLQTYDIYFSYSLKLLLCSNGLLLSLCHMLIWTHYRCFCLLSNLPHNVLAFPCKTLGILAFESQ